MSDSHALVGAYAVDAVDDDERARFEEHLVECGDCRAELDGLRAAAGMLASAAPVTPPAALRDAVLADIATVRPLPPEVTRLPRRPRRWAPFLAAAAAAVIVGGAGVAWQPWDDDQPGTSVAPTAADRVLQAPDAEEVSLSIEDAEATVVRSKREGKAVLVTRDMPPPPAGKVYQAWLQDATGHLSPAGLMPEGSDNTLVLSGDATEATGVGITVEPAGGSRIPKTSPIAVFAFSKGSA